MYASLEKNKMKIARDKWIHFFTGIPMGAVLQFILILIFPHNDVWAIIITGIMVIAISYGFELFSKITGWGRYDFMDAVASVIGGAIGMGGVMIINY